MQDYLAFLSTKRIAAAPVGFDIADREPDAALYPFQSAAVRWALCLGKAALFEERGLGKTIQEFEWSRHVTEHTGRPVLILTPLAVAYQMLREAVKFGYALTYVRDAGEVLQGRAQGATLFVTNYERLADFDTSVFGGVVLDESSILKAFSGKTKRALIEAFARTPYKLAASATPAPNDHLELGNHAEFLDVMPSNEMIARWFINNSMKAGDYRLKRHAAKDFWRWLTSWALCLSRPGDLGPDYDMPGYDLPPLHVHQHVLTASDAAYRRAWSEGRLLPDDSPSSTTIHKVKRESLSDRVSQAQVIISALPDDEPAVLWCDTNYESDGLMAAFPTALEVRGSDKPDVKAERLRAFGDGESRLIVTKPDIAGMGLNWQHCAVQVFAGVSFSFEKFYQAVGRSHRYGQTREVHAHLIVAETEGNVLATLQRKQAAFDVMQQAMNAAMSEHGLFRDDGRRGLISAYGATPIILPSWLKSKGAA
jgi:hypothetical protein